MRKDFNVENKNFINMQGRTMSTQGWFKKGLSIVLLIQILVAIPDFGLQASPQGRSLTFRKGDAIRLTIWQPWRLADGKAQISNFF